MTINPASLRQTLLNRDSQRNSEKADPIFDNHQWDYDEIMASNLESQGNVISSSL